MKYVLGKESSSIPGVFDTIGKNLRLYGMLQTVIESLLRLTFNAHSMPDIFIANI